MLCDYTVIWGLPPTSLYNIYINHGYNLSKVGYRESIFRHVKYKWKFQTRFNFVLISNIEREVTDWCQLSPIHIMTFCNDIYWELCKISHLSQFGASEQTLVMGFQCFIKFYILKGGTGRLRYAKYWSWEFYLSPHFIVTTIYTVITSFQVTPAVQVTFPGSNSRERGEFTQRGDVRFPLLFLLYFILIYSIAIVPIFPSSIPPHPPLPQSISTPLSFL